MSVMAPAFWRACAIYAQRRTSTAPSRRIIRMFLLTWEAVPAFHHDGNFRKAPSGR
jgi:hypothetical protein